MENSINLALTKAFVIGPIGDRDAEPGSTARVTYEEAIQVFEEVIAPACKSLGIEAVRADHIHRTGEITDQIFRQLRDSSLVVADLTGANPNVMYELGLRHTTGKLTIQIGERERLPFDVAAIRTVMFKRTEGGLVEARRKLVMALATGLEAGGDPVTATRVWFDQPKAFDAKYAGATTDPSEDELGFLEKIAQTDEVVKTMALTLGTVGAITEEMTRLFNDSTKQIQALDESSGHASSKLAVANRLAVLLEEPASKLEVTAGEYAQSVARMEPGIRYMVEAAIEDPEQLKAAPEFAISLRMLTEGSRSSAEQTLVFKAINDKIGSATRSLRQVSARISIALQSIADSSQRVASWKSFLDKLP